MKKYIFYNLLLLAEEVQTAKKVNWKREINIQSRIENTNIYLNYIAYNKLIFLLMIYLLELIN